MAKLNKQLLPCFELAYMFKEILLFCGDNIYFVTNVTELPEKITMETSWEIAINQRGMYIFMPVVKVNEFLSKFYTYWEMFSDRLKFLWINNPDDESSLWGTHALFCQPLFDLNVFELVRQWGFRFHDYHIVIPKGTKISYNSEGFLFLSYCINFFMFQTVLKATKDKFILNFSGINSGAFAFNGIIYKGEDVSDSKEDVSNSKSENIIALINAGIHYSMKSYDENNSKEFEISRFNGFLNKIENTVLKYNKQLNLNCLINPCFPTSSKNTAFYLPPSVVFDSTFTSVSGKKLRLKTTNSSKFVFQIEPDYLYTKKVDNKYIPNLKYYLGIEGEFEIIQPEENINFFGNSLLCGFSGTEYINFRDAQKIVFVPNCPAFVENVENSSIINIDSENLLLLSSQYATSSWIMFSEGAKYYSQPKTSPFFSSQGQGLKFRQIPLYIVEKNAPAVPFMPYSSCIVNCSNEEVCEKIEDAIYKTRYNNFIDTNMQMFQTMNNYKNDADELAVTPHGLLAGLQKNTENKILGNFNWIALANHNHQEYMKFVSPDYKMRMLFQNVNMNVLFKDPVEIINHVLDTENFIFSSMGWKFKLDPKDWNVNNMDDDTFMVLKFSKTSTIYEMLSDFLPFIKLMNNCYDDKGNEKQDYKEFLNVVNDKQFQGMLFCNCKVEVDENSPDFLPELKPLMNSLGKQSLKAHNVIFYKSKVKLDDNGNLSLERSSVSALLDYNQGQKITYNREADKNPDYYFSTVQMLISIKDREIIKIVSSSELLINTIFNTSCKKEGDIGGNCLILDGELSKNDGYGAFKYTLKAGGRFKLSKGMLEYVDINTVMFTANNNGGGVFNIGGKLFFLNLPEADLFSFGIEKDKSTGKCKEFGLLYNNLQITMKLTKKQDKSDEILWNMHMEYDNLCLQQIEGESRQFSFARRFPVKLSSLIFEPYKQSPYDRGYVPIQVPIMQSKTTNPWFALSWILPLGSYGDLSEGRIFDIEIITAWSVSQNSEGCFIGVKMPAAFGGGGIEIQNILKLSFSSIELVVKKENTPIEKVDFSLKLNQFVIKVLWTTFPPNSNVIHIVADESGKKLGWYAAYNDEG